jgi:hypothetical protein
VDRTTGQELWDNLTRHYQTYQYSDIFISHAQWGYAVHKDWEYNVLLGTGGYQYAIYVGAGDDGGVQIPGFQTDAVLVIAIVTTTGIGLSLNRKRKRLNIKN